MPKYILMLTLAAAAVLSAAPPADAFSGVGAITAQKAGDFKLTWFNGTTAGRDSAYTYCGTNGIVQLGPGTETLGYGSIPVGVVVLRAGYQGWEVAGRGLKISPLGTLRFAVDSTGIATTGKSVISDSLRVNRTTELVGALAVSAGKATVSDSLRANLGIQVGGQQIKKHLSATAALDFDLTSVVSQDLTITVTGAAMGDTVYLGIPDTSVTADTAFIAWVSAANTVKVRAFRLAGTPNPASGTFRVDVWQH